jgi:mono/diheme cytochrome c family protein
MRQKRNPIVSLIVCNLLVWMAASQISARAQNPDAAQIEKGRQVVAQVCSSCHTTIATMLRVHKQSREQWRDTVYFMISRGAQIMPDEIDAVTDYLTSTSSNNAQTTTQRTPGRAGGRAGQEMAALDGRAILQRTCQQCHELATASNKQASEDWTAVITRMINYGARLSPADQQKLIGYLNGLEK